MFQAKQKRLYTPPTSGKASNGFLAAAKGKAAETHSGNGALKYTTTGNDFMDDFGSVSSYKKPRTYQEIDITMRKTHFKNPFLSICMIFYIRMITRIVAYVDGSKTQSVQRGQGLKHEGIFRMIWLEINDPNRFWNNIHLYISVGSWKDIITMLSYDLQWNGYENRKLNWNLFGKLILAGLENPNTSELVKKYLPQIKSNSQCKTLEAQADNIIAKWICSLLFGNKGDQSGYTYKKYRKLKSTGTAHQWQQLISQGKHKLIDFDTIHGRALSLLVSSKYIKNNGLEAKYKEWIANKPVAKFTGYVHELADLLTKAKGEKYKIDTVDAQYNQLLALAGKTNTNMIVVKDTSGSMDSQAHGLKISSYTVAKAMSIFLGNMINGYFHNHYIDFSSTAYLREIKGNKFSDHWITETRIQSANTNFQAVCDLLCDIRAKGVSEEDFPSGIICISDGEFDRIRMFDGTNIEAFKRKMYRYFTKDFVDNFKFCFWDIHNTFYQAKRVTKFETHSIQKNVFYFSGFDPSVISFLTGTESRQTTLPSNAEELFNVAMNQEVLNKIIV